MEKLGLVHDVRWPVKERIDAKLVCNQRSSDVPAAA
jgi:hypothetical protein